MAIFVATALGCSKGGDAAANRVGTHQVTGKVTYKGQPVAGAHVSFHPKSGQGPGAFGRTDAEGAFALQTYEPGDGAAAGEYVVTVQKIETPAASSASGEDLFRQMEEKSKSGQQPADGSGEPKSLLPEKYGSPESSDLKAVVPGTDPQAFEFDLQD
jgi:hypothetical protein